MRTIELGALLAQKQSRLEFDTQEFLDDIQAEVTVRLVLTECDSIIRLKGTLDSEVPVACSRCLEDMVMPLSIELDDYAYGPDHEVNFLDPHLLYSSKAVLDISPWIIDEILARTTQIVVCKYNCLGLCTDCGVNRNKESCQCSESQIDPRWQKLARFLPDSIQEELKEEENGST